MGNVIYNLVINTCSMDKPSFYPPEAFLFVISN